MPHHNRWQLQGPHGQPLFGNTHLPDGHPPNTQGVAVLCHGFKGYKDYGLFPRLAESLAEAGWIVHRFNASFSGMTHDTQTFGQADLFEQDTWGKQVLDTMDVAEKIATGDLPGQGLPLVLFGHSRGGLVATVAARRLQGAANAPTDDADKSKAAIAGVHLAGVVTAAGVSTPMRYSKQEIETLQTEGKLVTASARTGQELTIGRAFLDDMLEQGLALDPCHAAAGLSCPMRIVHGADDETVGVAEAHALAAANPAAELVVVPGANHVFNAPNPLPLDAPIPGETQQLIDAVVGFFQEKAAVSQAR